ncbi:type I restriction enzyme HsdR N-terminal domain-containing protein [Thermodesulfobacteriota bacterium]
MSEKFLEAFFSQLREFKEYPKYQYERRIDGFIGFFLPAVLKSHDINVSKIIPEFPVKAHPEYALSNNIDYMLFDSSKNCVTLVELKTDSVSVSEKQLEYYIETMNTPWGELKTHVKRVRQKSKQENKYKFLSNQMENIPDDVIMDAIYLAPADALPLFESGFKSACQTIGTEFNKEWKRWRFLSLKEFANSEKVETEYQAEWQYFADALKTI